MNYRCVEIPEPDFDASFTDEMVVTAYQDEEDFNPCMPDEYPNIRLAELEKKIDETTLQASEAYEAASNASDISELAKTTASAAVTEIVEHEATITNPHPANTTQDFAAVNISGLKSDLNGGSVSADDYNWFKRVYSSLVDGSVISWITGLVNQVKSLANRVGLLEDKYILKYVVPVDTAAIDLTTDKYGNAFNFVEGDQIIISIISVFNVIDRVVLRINRMTSSIYNRGGAISTSFVLINVNRINTKANIKLMYCNGELIGSSECNADDNGINPSTAIISLSTKIFNMSSIYSIQLLTSGGNKYLQNSTIIIKKI